MPTSPRCSCPTVAVRQASRRVRRMQRPSRPRTSPTTKAAAVRELARLEEIPSVGPAVAADLRQLGINQPADLPGRDPYGMYDDLCRITGQRMTPACSTRSSPLSGSWRVSRKSPGGSARQKGRGCWRHEKLRGHDEDRPVTSQAASPRISLPAEPSPSPPPRRGRPPARPSPNSASACR